MERNQSANRKGFSSKFAVWRRLEFWSLNILVVLIGFLSLAATVQTCGEDVVIPAADTTPPTAALFHLVGGTVTSVVDDMHITVNRGDRFSVVGVGTDSDSGLFGVWLYHYQYVDCCRDDGRCYNRTNNLTDQYFDPNKTTGQIANTSASVYDEIHIDDTMCASGENFQGVIGYIFTIAQNYKMIGTQSPQIVYRMH